MGRGQAPRSTRTQAQGSFRSLAGARGTAPGATGYAHGPSQQDAAAGEEGDTALNSIVYIVGAVVIVIAILSFLGLR
jgi:hypothetical protein